MRTEVTKMKKSQKAFKKAPAPGQTEFDPLPRSKGNFRALTLLPISDNLLNRHKYLIMTTSMLNYRYTQ